jgi:hypothetical protein
MEQTRKKIDLELVKSYMDDSYQLIRVNRRDNLNDNPGIIGECVEKSGADPLYDFFDGYFGDSESDAVDEAARQLKSTLEEDGYDSDVIEAFFGENEEEIRSEIYDRADNDDIDDMLRNTRDIPVRIEILSNYDCINSHWLESQGGFSYESSYFGDMVDALWLNPKRVKQILAEHGENVCGRFPDRKYRDGREFVSYERFYTELINSTCGANLLTFTATINPTKLYESGFNLAKLTIPKGNECGLFSSAYGGGSIIEMKLLRDMTIDLTRTKYPQFRLALETDGKAGDYSIKQVYGIDESVYGKPLRIEPLHGDKRISA